VLPRVSFDKDIATLFDAIDRRKRVSFTYRTGGGGEPQERSVEPYRLIHRGTWYLAGYDRARADVRFFKLSRVEGAVTVNAGRDPDFEQPSRTDLDVSRGPWEGETTIEARVAFSPETGWWAERHTGASRVAERDDGWIELRMPVAEMDSFAGWLAGFADHAVALEPAELRDAVVARLVALAEGA
jgi:proteasome accessory factor B